MLKSHPSSNFAPAGHREQGVLLLLFLLVYLYPSPVKNQGTHPSCLDVEQQGLEQHHHTALYHSWVSDVFSSVTCSLFPSLIQGSYMACVSLTLFPDFGREFGVVDFMSE